MRITTTNQDADHNHHHLDIRAEECSLHYSQTLEEELT